MDENSLKGLIAIIKGGKKKFLIRQTAEYLLLLGVCFGLALISMPSASLNIILLAITLAALSQIRIRWQ